MQITKIFFPFYTSKLGKVLYTRITTTLQPGSQIRGSFHPLVRTIKFVDNLNTESIRNKFAGVADLTFRVKKIEFQRFMMVPEHIYVEILDTKPMIDRHTSEELCNIEPSSGGYNFRYEFYNWNGQQEQRTTHIFAKRVFCLSYKRQYKTRTENIAWEDSTNGLKFVLQQNNSNDKIHQMQKKATNSEKVEANSASQNNNIRSSQHGTSVDLLKAENDELKRQLVEEKFKYNQLKSKMAKIRQSDDNDGRCKVNSWSGIPIVSYEVNNDE